MMSFLLEVGTEELPANFLGSAIVQWRSLIPQSLANHGLNPEKVEVYGTPRRLAVVITGLPEKQADRTEEIKGPAAQAAFKDGQATQAAIGFANKQGVDISKLEIRSTEKGNFIFINKKIPGRPVSAILQELIPQWVWSLEGKRLMRWGSGDGRFSRPIRWLVALLNGDVLPLELQNGEKIVKSDRMTRCHRVLHPENITISQASEYVNSLNDGYVIVTPETRENIIIEQVKNAAAKLGGYTPIYQDLLKEVINLVEYPTAVIGKFEEDFLNLPTEVITEVMVSHQRYFPVFKNEKCEELLPYFITISNGDPAKSDVIASGNAKVIRARLADGRFFYEADLSKHLETLLPQLEKVTFQEELGSMRSKVNRIVINGEKISNQLLLEKHQSLDIQRSALLCKADLVTQMVYEFPELQGIMGQKYALANGENHQVSTAIFEHYLPRNANDIFPQTLTGQVVGIADRLDTLICIFGIGAIPTSSSDPFALRRAANGIINITWNANLQINLGGLIDEIAQNFATTFNKDAKSLITKLREFFLQRLKSLLQDEKQIDYDLVNAVLGDDVEYAERALTNLLDVRDRAIYLQQIRKDGTMDKIYETVNRSTRLAAQGKLNYQELEPEKFINLQLFQKTSESDFYNALVNIVPQTKESQKSRNYQLLVSELVKIAPTVTNFFDGENSVLVMDENPQIKENRLNLLGLLRNHSRVLADFGAIVKNL
ncbi:glycine--tRNA ligase subunit beta [Anabaena sp. FACHB-1237]|uniref:glycine--tRNA ligase subunit beta n=1 Tax=Anabaena sp. FACHB-1237 TaxID=2692769 RepID=UPI0016818B79|nr:glycine--tRNA ligase subunit beta [Anabaena sp. FACHB-1237]MBD2138280.1 glycine--tRNA ligase subunit beta [Anabaena sp. FACHB-1237]